MNPTPRLSPLNPDPRTSFAEDVEAANDLFRQGKTAEALAVYDALLVQRPDSHELLYNRASALRLLGRYEEAVTAGAQAVRAQPKNIQAWTNLGDSLRSINRLNEALTVFMQVLSISQTRKDQARANHNAAIVLRDLGRDAEALTFSRAAFELDPLACDYGFTLGELFLRTGDFESGWKLYGLRHGMDHPPPVWHAIETIEYEAPPLDPAPADIRLTTEGDKPNLRSPVRALNVVFPRSGLAQGQ